ncbi:MAG: GxxExxY protein [Gracilimonas sp.]|uniref:GxxExxY protein n=1 Tax=Gracilimonas TaxID=649462 RepID=UPI001B0F29AE|nr:GxxExxY protein [Gracilimonas sp.]MBO6584953.1 GxxExxY protein [Gracilimonas sp.]MBO6615776.1 GxxExxY protein [Gracilimonas sp.]
MNQTKTPNFKYKQLTGKIIGAAMQVHSELGNGFREIVYHRSMEHELSHQGLNYKSELTMPLYYRDAKVGARRVDLLVEEKILVELKAVGEINDQHISQVLNYLKAYKLEVALLLNFGENSLNFKRIAKLKNYKN